MSPGFDVHQTNFIPIRQYNYITMSVGLDIFLRGSDVPELIGTTLRYCFNDKISAVHVKY
jgi:hypothetical protein